MSDYDAVAARQEIVDAVDRIFDTVDTKDWDAVERLFTDRVWADFTSLAGGEPAEISNVQLVDGWRAGLHAKKQSFHMVGHYRISVGGDSAVAHVKGYAYNALDKDLGGGMWEVWGSYDIPFRLTGAGWKATGLTLNALQTRGDDEVRTHLLS